MIGLLVPPLMSLQGGSALRVDGSGNPGIYSQFVKANAQSSSEPTMCIGPHGKWSGIDHHGRRALLLNRRGLQRMSP